MFGIGQVNAANTKSIYPSLVDLGCGPSIMIIPISTFFQKAWTEFNLGKMDQTACWDPQDIAEKGIILLIDINRARRRICRLLNRDIMFHCSYLNLNSSIRVACSLAPQTLVDEKLELV